MALQDLRHFKEIFAPIPSGTEKLLAVWDDLTIETQIEFLHSINETRYPEYLAKKVFLKAFSSSNPYIRYLAVRPGYRSYGMTNLRTFLTTQEFEEIKKKISDGSYLILKHDGTKHSDYGDPSLLVKYSNIDFDGSVNDFYDLPQAARLAISHMWSRAEDEIVEIIEHAPKYIEIGKITTSEVIEIFENYFGGSNFALEYKSGLPLDGFIAYYRGQELVKIWSLLLELPTDLHLPLLEHLPIDSGLGSMPEDIPYKLCGDSLDYLLMRDDIEIRDFRKEIFYDMARERHRHWAVSHNFNLDYNEFYDLLPKYKYELDNATNDIKIIWESEGEEVRGKLNDLQCANDLHWVYLYCLKDYFRSAPGRDLYDVQTVGDTLNRCYKAVKDKSLPDYYIEDQLLIIRLYILARKVTPWHNHSADEIFEIYSPNGILDFLRGAIVKDDRWKTCMGFVDQWHQQHNRDELKNYLPRVYDFGEEDVEESVEILDQDFFNQRNEFISIEKKLTDLEDSIKLVFRILIGVCVFWIWKLS